MTSPLKLAIPLLLGCSRPERGSVLLITLDTTRADHLGPYGYGAAQTPVYDAFASQGVLWRRAYSTAPLTIVSHATILTGRAPPAHGVRDNGDFVLGPEQITLAERFQAAGYRTVAITSAFPTQARWGLNQGFDVYHDQLQRRPTELDWRDERRASEVIDDALATLAAQPEDAPLFVWVHLFDAHWPYQPPGPYLRQFPHDPYDGEIAYVSDQVGRLLRWWDEARPDNAVLITADHGEGLGDGGERTHGFLLTDGTLRVPMMARGHGALARALPAGTQIADPVGHVDVAPTLLRLAGLPLGPELQGRDLREGGSDDLYSEAMTGQYSLGLSPLFARTDGAGRYTEGVFGAFYPTAGDQVANVADPSADLALGAQALADLRDRIGLATAPGAALNATALAQLQALGYMGGDPNAAAGTVDPRDVIDVLPLTWEIRRDLAEAPDRADANLAVLEARMPGAWGVDLLRAQQLRALGRLDEALDAFTDLYTLSPSATIALQVADLWRASADDDEALAWYQEALALEPTSPEAMLGVVLCAQGVGLDADAASLAEQFLAEYPDHAELVLIRADLLLRAGRADEAASEARWALERMPREPWAWLVASRTRWALGDADAAIDLLTEALALDRLDLGLRLELVDRLIEVGRRAEAKRALAPARRLLPDHEAVLARVERLTSTAASSPPDRSPP